MTGRKFREAREIGALSAGAKGKIENAEKIGRREAESAPPDPLSRPRAHPGALINCLGQV
jgi:hypothetical protein